MTIPTFVYVQAQDGTSSSDLSALTLKAPLRNINKRPMMPRIRPHSCRALLLRSSKEDSSSSLNAPPALPRRKVSRSASNYQKDDQVQLALQAIDCANKSLTDDDDDQDNSDSENDRPDYKRSESNRSSLTEPPRMPQRKDSRVVAQRSDACSQDLNCLAAPEA